MVSYLVISFSVPLNSNESFSVLVFDNSHCPYLSSSIIVVLYLSYSQLVVAKISSSVLEISSVPNETFAALKVFANVLDKPNCKESLFELSIFTFVPMSDSKKSPHDFVPRRFTSDNIIFPLPFE